MSENIPFDIQVEIIKSLPIKSLILFRLVSKQWKSLISSSKFIAEHNTHQKHKHRLLVHYIASDNYSDVKLLKYVSMVDDDTFPQHMFSLTVPTPLNKLNTRDNIVSSQGLLFVLGSEGSGTRKVHIWNPTIRKSVDIDVCVADTYFPYRIHSYFGFGVCPDTCDPKIVKITSSYPDSNKRDTIFEVFTLSTKSWRRLSNNLPCKAISLRYDQAQVAIDRFMYWFAYEKIHADHGRFYWRNLFVSFDMKSEEFTEIHLPDHLALGQERIVGISSIRESLVMVLVKEEAGRQVRSVWKMMEHGEPKSFTKLYTINTTDVIQRVHGFRKSGEAIVETKKNRQRDLFVYELDSKPVNYIGISGMQYVFSVSSYFETLLLLDQ